MTVEEISAVVMDTCSRLHRELGPGLLKSVYQPLLAAQLERRGLRVERQPALAGGDADSSGSLPVDLLVEDRLAVGLQAIEAIEPLHVSRFRACLERLKVPFGLFINFGADNFQDAVKRVVNPRRDNVLWPAHAGRA